MFCISSCVYFNTFYNAKVSFNNARKMIDSMDFRETQIPAQAKTLLDEAISNSRLVINNHENSKFVKDAYYIISVSMFFKEDYKGAKDNFKKLIDIFPNEKIKSEAYLWLSYCELKLNNLDISKHILDKEISKVKLSKNEKYLFNIINAELLIKNEQFSDAYLIYQDAIKYAATDAEKIKIYNQLIKVSYDNDDYLSLVKFLDDIYPFLKTVKEKKEIKLLSIKYNKELDNFKYVVSEIQQMLNQSIFNDIRIKLFSELGKVYFEMGDYYAAKQIFEEITLSYSKKDETAEAYYYLARINLMNDFDINLIKDFLSSAKSEKSSSKHGKLARSLIGKIDVLESTIDEYTFSIDDELADSIDSKISDSLLFNIAQIYQFDFGQIDSAIFRYNELINKFPKSKFNSKAILVLSQIDNTNTQWSNNLSGDNVDIISSEDEADDNQIQNAFNLLDIGDYNRSYEMLKKIYDDKESKNILLYLGYIDEYYKFDIVNMLHNYISFLNVYNNHSNSSIIKNKLSAYYYLFNQQAKTSHLKLSLLKCNKMIDENINYYLNKTQHEMISDCYSNIEGNLLAFSEDSLKVKITELNILNQTYSKFKRDMLPLNFEVQNIEQEVAYLYQTIQSIDSVSTSLNDSTMTIIKSYVQLNQGEIEKDIKQMSDYLLIFDNLSVGLDDAENNNNKSQPMMNFENLNLDGLDLEKLELK